MAAALLRLPHSRWKLAAKRVTLPIALRRRRRWLSGNVTDRARGCVTGHRRGDAQWNEDSDGDEQANQNFAKGFHLGSPPLWFGMQPERTGNPVKFIQNCQTKIEKRSRALEQKRNPFSLAKRWLKKTGFSFRRPRSIVMLQNRKGAVKIEEERAWHKQAACVRGSCFIFVRTHSCTADAILQRSRVKFLRGFQFAARAKSCAQHLPPSLPLSLPLPRSCRW